MSAQPVLDGLDLWPDLPGYVHGIVCLDPATVQCDGCGRRDTMESLGLKGGRGRLTVVVLSSIRFSREDGFKRRLCRDCAREAGWSDR